LLCFLCDASVSSGCILQGKTWNKYLPILLSIVPTYAVLVRIEGDYETGKNKSGQCRGSGGGFSQQDEKIHQAIEAW